MIPAPGVFKRIRGPTLEKGGGHARQNIQSQAARDNVPQSALASKLLNCWSNGALSAKAVQEIAALAMQDGATHQEIFKLGKVGDWGRRPGNCHRDLLTSFCPQILLPEPFEVQVPCLHPKTSLEKEDGAGLFLPHLLFSHLGEKHPEFFEQVFCLTDSSLEKFWSAVEAVEDDRIVGHPMCLEKHWNKKNIPLLSMGMVLNTTAETACWCSLGGACLGICPA